MKTNVKQLLVESLLLKTSDSRDDIARLSRRLHARRELWREAVFEREWLRKENTRLRDEARWIPTSERLPERYERVQTKQLNWLGEPWYGYGWVNEHGMWGGYPTPTVLAWRALPSPPEVQP